MCQQKFEVSPSSFLFSIASISSNQMFSEVCDIHISSISISSIFLLVRLRSVAAMEVARDSLDSCSPQLRSLEDIFTDAGVDSVLGNALISEGWTTRTFAMAAASLADIQPSSLLEDDISPLQQACLRLAWQSCQNLSSSSGSPVQVTASSSGTSGSWQESFAPKLTDDSIVQMKADFRKFYPSEILVLETTPSTRLLSLIHHQLQKKHWTWVPWKFRLSVSRSEEVKSGRSAKLPKIEGLGLHELLLDNPESIEITNVGMGVNSIRSMLELHNYGIAMCRGAHLGNLKAFSQKFLSYLTVRLDPELGLRVPSVLEAQAADRSLWNSISELMNERSWSLDDCLHEFTHIRADLSVLLQPRPKVVKMPAPIRTTPTDKGPGKTHKGSFKSKGKQSKGGGPQGKGKQTWVAEYKVGDEWKPICMKFQTNKCSMDNCRYAHVCASPKTDGTACAGRHSAFDHQSTGH